MVLAKIFNVFIILHKVNVIVRLAGFGGSPGFEGEGSALALVVSVDQPLDGVYEFVNVKLEDAPAEDEED
jgi:hypothetical protein